MQNSVFDTYFLRLRSCQGSRQLVLRGMSRGIEAWHFGGETNHHVRGGNSFLVNVLKYW